MNGIIVIDKPIGKTSHDMVNFMRRMTGIRRIGHTGTLDPMASGVLPICIGSAAKAADMLTASDKGYAAELVLGMTTDTQDAEGEVLTECGVSHLSEKRVREAVMSFKGEYMQTPPMYSAIKRNGKKLYELARRGISVEREKRRVSIFDISVTAVDMENYKVAFEVSCSKGTYIRALCEDIGAKLGVGAYMNVLRRTRSGGFSIEDAYTAEEIEEMAKNGSLAGAIKSVDCVFEEYESIRLNEKQTKSIKNGVRMSWRDGSEGTMYRLYDSGGGFLCVSRLEEGRLKLVKSFWS